MDESLISSMLEDGANYLSSVRDMSCCAPRTGRLMRGACTKLACKLSRDNFCLKAQLGPLTARIIFNVLSLLG